MASAIDSALERLLGGRDLTADAMHAAIGQIMDGEAAAAEIGALLTALRIKGETVDELIGAAGAMRQRATAISSNQAGLLDTCGTGGDGLRTFNISTATAFVAAAAGAPVAKHGNRSVSSSSGSADVLEALGINIQLSPEQVGRCLDEVGLGFCFAPLVHGAMRYAAPVRRQLGFRTIFNMLGPLTNPAGAEHQLVGAYSPESAELLAGALAGLGVQRAVVVCGGGRLDEVSLWGETIVFLAADGTVRSETWTAESFGLPPCRPEELQVNSAEESAAVLRDLFAGRPGPARNIVVANSAAALLAAGRAGDLHEAVDLAGEAIDGGRAAQLRERLAEFSHRH